MTQTIKTVTCTCVDQPLCVVVACNWTHDNGGRGLGVPWGWVSTGPQVQCDIPGPWTVQQTEWNEQSWSHSLSGNNDPEERETRNWLVVGKVVAVVTCAIIGGCGWCIALCMGWLGPVISSCVLGGVVWGDTTMGPNCPLQGCPGIWPGRPPYTVTKNYNIKVSLKKKGGKRWEDKERRPPYIVREREIDIN